MLPPRDSPGANEWQQSFPSGLQIGESGSGTPFCRGCSGPAAAFSVTPSVCNKAMAGRGPALLAGRRASNMAVPPETRPSRPTPPAHCPPDNRQVPARHDYLQRQPVAATYEGPPAHPPWYPFPNPSAGGLAVPTTSIKQNSLPSAFATDALDAAPGDGSTFSPVIGLPRLAYESEVALIHFVVYLVCAAGCVCVYYNLVVLEAYVLALFWAVIFSIPLRTGMNVLKRLILLSDQQNAAAITLARASEASPPTEPQRRVSASAALPPVNARSVFLNSPPRIASSASSELTGECHTGTPPPEGTGGFVNPRVYRHRSTSESIATRIASRLLPSVAPTAAAAESLLAQENLVIAEKLEKVSDSLREATEKGKDSELSSPVGAGGEMPSLDSLGGGNVQRSIAPSDATSCASRQEEFLCERSEPSCGADAAPRQHSGLPLQVNSSARRCLSRSPSLSPPLSRVGASDPYRGRPSPGKGSPSPPQAPVGDVLPSPVLERAVAMDVAFVSESRAQGDCPSEPNSPARYTESPPLIHGESTLSLPTPPVSPVSPRSAKTAPPFLPAPGAARSVAPAGDDCSSPVEGGLTRGSPRQQLSVVGVPAGKKTHGDALLAACATGGNDGAPRASGQPHEERIRSGATSPSDARAVAASSPWLRGERNLLASRDSSVAAKEPIDSRPPHPTPQLAASLTAENDRETQAEPAQAWSPAADASRDLAAAALTHGSDRGRKATVSHRRNLDLHRRLRSCGSASFAVSGAGLNTSFGQYTALRCEGRAACKRIRSSRGKDESSGGAEASSPAGKQKHRKLSSATCLIREPSWSLLGDVILSSALVRLPARFLLFMIAPLLSLVSPRPGRASARHASRPWFALLYRGCVLLLAYRAVSSYSSYSVSTVLLGAAGLGLLSITVRFLLILAGKERAANRCLSWLSLPSLLTPVRRLLSLFHGSMQTSLNPILAIVVMLTSMLIFSLIVAFFCFQFYNEITLLWDAFQRSVDTYILQSSTLQQAFHAIHTFVSPSDRTGDEEPSSSLYNTTIPSAAPQPLSASKILFNLVSKAAQAASGGGVADFGGALFGDSGEDSSGTMESRGPSSALRSPFSSLGIARAFGGLGASVAATVGGKGKESAGGVGTAAVAEGGGGPGNEGAAASNSALKQLLGGSIGRYSDLWLSIRHLANAGSLQNGAAGTPGLDKRTSYDRRTGHQEEDRTGHGRVFTVKDATADSGESAESGHGGGAERRSHLNQGWWRKRDVNRGDEEENAAGERDSQRWRGRKCRKRRVRLTSKGAETPTASSLSVKESSKEADSSVVGWTFPWLFRWRRSSETEGGPVSQALSADRQGFPGNHQGEKEAQEVGGGLTTRRGHTGDGSVLSCAPQDMPLFPSSGKSGPLGSCVRSKEQINIPSQQDKSGGYVGRDDDEKEVDALACFEDAEDFSSGVTNTVGSADRFSVNSSYGDAIESADERPGHEEIYASTAGSALGGADKVASSPGQSARVPKTEGEDGGSANSGKSSEENSSAVGFWTGGDRAGEDEGANQRLTGDVWKRWENTAELIGQLRKGNLSGAAGKVKEAWSEIYSLTSEGWWSYVTTYANTFFSGLLNSGFGAFRVFFFVFFLVFKFLLSAFDMLLQAVVFFSALYYLLCSSRSCLEYLEELLCIVDPSCIVSHSINRGLRAILYSSVKRVWFYSLFTWFVYESAGMPVVYVPTAVSGLLALLPLLPPEMISVIPCLVLWWGGGGAEDTAAVAALALAQSRKPGEYTLPFQRPLSRAEAEAEAMATGSWWGVLSVTAGSQRKLGAVALLAANAAVWWNVTTAIYREIPDSNPWLVGLSVALGLSTFGLKGIIIGPVLATIPLIVLTAAAKFSERRAREHQLAATVAQKRAPPVCASTTSSPVVSPSSLSAACGSRFRSQRHEDRESQRRSQGPLTGLPPNTTAALVETGSGTHNERAVVRLNNLSGKSSAVPESTMHDVPTKKSDELDSRLKSEKGSDSGPSGKKGDIAEVLSAPDVSEVISGPPATPSAAAAAVELAKAANQAAAAQVASLVGETAEQGGAAPCGTTSKTVQTDCVSPTDIVPSAVPFQVRLRSGDDGGTTAHLHRADPVFHSGGYPAFLYGPHPVDYPPWDQPFIRGAAQPRGSVTASQLGGLPPGNAHSSRSVFGPPGGRPQGGPSTGLQQSTASLFPAIEEGGTSFMSAGPLAEEERVAENSFSEDSRRSSNSSVISSGTSSRDEGWWSLPDGDQVTAAAPLSRRRDSKLPAAAGAGRRGRTSAFAGGVFDGVYTGSRTLGRSSNTTPLKGRVSPRVLLESKDLNHVCLAPHWPKRGHTMAGGLSFRAPTVVSAPGVSGRRLCSRASRVRCASYHGRENTSLGNGSGLRVWPPRSEASFLTEAAPEATFLYPLPGGRPGAGEESAVGVHTSTVTAANPRDAAPMLPPLFQRMLVASSSWGREGLHSSRGCSERDLRTGGVGRNRGHFVMVEGTGSASGEDADPGADESDEGAKPPTGSCGRAGETSRSSMLAAAVLKTAEKLEWLLERPTGGLVNSITTGSAPASMSSTSSKLEDATKKDGKKVTTVRTIAKSRRQKLRGELTGLSVAGRSKSRTSGGGGRRATTPGAGCFSKRRNGNPRASSGALVGGVVEYERVEGAIGSQGVPEEQLGKAATPVDDAADTPDALRPTSGSSTGVLNPGLQGDAGK